MINIIKKELIIFTGLLTLLIVLMHPDLLTQPTARLGLMQEKGNYIHPLLYTFIVYLILYFFRFVFSFVMKFFNRKDK
jgi:ABC-type multidrug transport system fused ATPase/permease subunit